MRYELLARDMFLSDLATDLDAAEKKGIEKGKVAIALKMIDKGKSYEEISEITELSIKQIGQLAQNNKVKEPVSKYKSKRKTKKSRKK
jgi:hypothetical protein